MAAVTLADRIRELLKAGQEEPLRLAVGEERPEDLADALVRLEPEEASRALLAMEEETAAEVLVELPTDSARSLFRELPDHLVAWYLDILPMDDAIELEEDLGSERFARLLGMIPEEDARELRRLMQYPKESVGRLMTEHFFEAAPTQTMASLLDDLRNAPTEKYETVNDVYVLDQRRHLIGVFSLRKMLRAAPITIAEEVMNEDVVIAQATEDAEEAARRMARYGFYALPVLDERGRMLGIFTGDDAQAILREEETRDVLALGAVQATGDSYVSQPIPKLYRSRIVWLLALFVAETLTGAVMRHYGQSDDGIEINPLIYFVPLLIGAGGNAGSQVTTTITRALALGEVTPRDWWLVMRRELVVALMIGGTLGSLGFLRAFLPTPFGWGEGIQLSLIVMLALPSIIVWSAFIGSILPLAAKRLRIDPAVMSAPFITTFVDATGLIIYFEIAKAFAFQG